MPDFLDSLNERQRRAACHEDGGALVLAGAGTGKTRVLTSRMAWLSARGCPPRAILGVTFTNKAAKEMRARVSALAAAPENAFALGTFHGVCHRMLRIHAAAAGWDKNFQILDSSDQKTFIRRLLAANDISPEELPPGDVAQYINTAKDRGWRAAEAASVAPQHSREEMLGEIYLLYEKACRRENKMDFAELLLSAMELLRGDAELRAHYAARFRHILIDEFQDTSPLQYQWLRLLDSGDNCFFAVGDDDQSIYAFRGADVENMRRIQKDLRAGEIIRLEQNYRSTARILSAANALIAANKNRLGKNLFTDSGDGAPVRIRRAANDWEEAAEIAREIRDAVASGARADDIAVLYRANSQSRLLEKAMVEYGLPYRIYGGTRFFDRLEIKHALAYLRLAIADDRDALLRVINTPPRGIGAKTVESLTAREDLFAALADSSAPKVRAFYALLRKLRTGRDSFSLSEIADIVVKESGLLEYYESRPQEAERAENLREFVSAATMFAKEFAGGEEDGEDPVQSFLANAALESGESQGAQNGNGAAVNLMTVHAAKGLEFAAVHIAGLEDGTFPHARSLEDAAAAAVEEERRLMYVAITRARRELFLYFADRRMSFGQTVSRPPSRFLHELPADAVDGDISAAVSYDSAVNLGTSFRGGFFRDSAASAYPKKTHRRAAFPAKNTKGAKTAPEPAFDSLATKLPPDSGDAAESSSPFRPGAIVRHSRYGEGVVLRCEGGGEERTVEVAFKKIGKKTFVAALAPLRPVR